MRAAYIRQFFWPSGRCVVSEEDQLGRVLRVMGMNKLRRLCLHQWFGEYIDLVVNMLQLLFGLRVKEVDY